MPERMHALVPNAKLVYLIRDPIERALSHAVHAVRKGRLPPTVLERFFDPPDDLDRSHPEYRFHAFDRDYYCLHPSRYHHQLSAYLPFYGRDRILVVTSEELRDDRRATLATVFDFIGVPADHDSPTLRELHHRSDSPRVQRRDGAVVDKPVLTAGQRRRMAEFLKPDIHRLRLLTGRRFLQWSV